MQDLKDSKNPTLFNLQPFQEEYIKGDDHHYNTITRVPGGFIYKTFVYDNPALKEDELKVIAVSSVFLPTFPHDHDFFVEITVPIH